MRMQWKIKKIKNAFRYLIRSTSFDREILKPALATASILNEASTVLKELVLTNKTIKPMQKRKPFHCKSMFLRISAHT